MTCGCVTSLLKECSLSDVLLQDAFFYSLVYDPQQKTLLADKGEIRVGQKFQADVILALKEGSGHSTVAMLAGLELYPYIITERFLLIL